VIQKNFAAACAIKRKRNLCFFKFFILNLKYHFKTKQNFRSGCVAFTFVPSSSYCLMKTSQPTEAETSQAADVVSGEF